MGSAVAQGATGPLPTVTALPVYAVYAGGLSSGLGRERL